MTPKIFYVYILKCADNTYYTGMTSNLENRLKEHENGVYEKSYTFSRRPVELQFVAEFTNPIDAIELERKLKKWSGQKKKALIEQNFDKLKELASCRNITHYLRSR